MATYLFGMRLANLFGDCVHEGEVVVARRSRAELVTDVSFFPGGECGLASIALAPVVGVSRHDGKVVATGRLHAFDALAIEVIPCVLHRPAGPGPGWSGKAVANRPRCPSRRRRSPAGCPPTAWSHHSSSSGNGPGSSRTSGCPPISRRRTAVAGSRDACCALGRPVPLGMHNRPVAAVAVAMEQRR